MPEPGNSSGVPAGIVVPDGALASASVPPALYAPGGTQAGAGRGRMTAEEFRRAGLRLNGGRRWGWKKRLAQLLDTPEATIAAWASRSPGNARPIPGVAAVAVRLLLEREGRGLAAETASHRFRPDISPPIRLDPKAPGLPFGPAGPPEEAPAAAIIGPPALPADVPFSDVALRGRDLDSPT